MAGAAEGADLANGLAREREIAADVEAEWLRLTRTPEGVPKQPLRLPGGQSIAGDLFGKLLRVSGEFESFLREHGGGSVVPVGAATLGREAGDDHVRLEGADDAHHVGEHLAPVPLGECLLVVLRKTKIPRPGKKLRRGVPACG